MTTHTLVTQDLLVIFDILFKVLKSKYGNNSVNYVRNITDVDDKIIKSSKEKNISISELTNNIIKDFNDDCNYLNLDNQSTTKSNRSY